MPDTPLFPTSPPPDRHPPLHEAAVALYLAGQIQPAAAAYRQAARSEAVVLGLLGTIAASFGQGVQAIDWIGQARRMAPDKAMLHAAFADAALIEGDLPQAVAALEQALFLDPSLAEIAARLDRVRNGPVMQARPSLHGSHAPERQVFMAAAVHRLCRTPGPLRLLEIGSAVGASALTWAAAIGAFCPHGGILTCVDAWDAPNAQSMFRHNTRFVSPSVAIQPIRGLSGDVLPTLTDRFDLIYVDGSHRHHDVVSDLRQSHHLIKDGGLICGDDLEIQFAAIDSGHARSHADSDFVPDPRTGRPYHPGVTLAVGEFFGEVSNYGGFWVMGRQGASYAPIGLGDGLGLFPDHWPEVFLDNLRRQFPVTVRLPSGRQAAAIEAWQPAAAPSADPEPWRRTLADHQSGMLFQRLSRLLDAP